MTIVHGRVVNGRIEVEGVILREGTDVEISLPADEEYDLTEEQEAEIEASIAEYERDALMVLRRLVLRAIKEEPADSQVWSNEIGSVDPEDVLYNLDRLVGDWDIGAAFEAEVGHEHAEG